MTQARKLTIHIPQDRIIHLPDDVPEGPAEVIVLYPDANNVASAPKVPGPEAGVAPLDERPGEGMFEGLVPTDDETMFGPLPREIQRYFDGESDDEDGLD